jgi:hypothetical protein
MRDDDKSMNRLPHCAVLILAIVGGSACDRAPDPGKAGPGKALKAYALDEVSAEGLLRNPKARAAYYKALGPLAKEPWLAKLDGPSPKNRRITIADADYYLLAACKNGDCEENSAVLLYSPAQDVVYGKIYQRGKSTLIGSPTLTVTTELEKLWRAEWRTRGK